MTDSAVHLVAQAAPPVGSAEGSIEWRVPEWSARSTDQTRRLLRTRAWAAAVLGIIAIAVMATLFGKSLPGEKQAGAAQVLQLPGQRQLDAELRAALAERRTAQAEQRTAAAEGRAAAGARRTAVAARDRAVRAGRPRDALAADRRARQAAQTQAVAARREQAASKRERAAIQRIQAVRTAQEAPSPQLAAAATTTDADLARVAVAGLLILIATVGAVALLAPRTEPRLTYLARTGRDRPGDGVGSGSAQAGGGQAGGGQTGGGQTGGGLRPPGPVLNQAVVTAVALIAGLFGIQRTEGWQEVLLNIALPVLPIIGGLFARRRVTPVPRK